tara:strand:+ start:387 stop:1328 length:942 start_codon:yes stop_codon:yes gene_type:complete
MDEIIKDAKFSNIDLKGNISYNNIIYNLNRNNIIISDKGLEKTIERNLNITESGFNFIINSKNKSIKLILPEDAYIGIFYKIYINNDIKSLEIIPKNNNDTSTDNLGDKIFGNYNIISSKTFSLSTLEKKTINTQYKLNGANKINLINSSSGTLNGGHLIIKCIDKIHNNIEGLNAMNLTMNSGTIYWNKPINLYSFDSTTNNSIINYKIRQFINSKWVLLKENYNKNFYNFTSIDNNVIFEVSVNDENNGVIINITLPISNNNDSDLLNYKIKYDYNYKYDINPINKFVWSLEGTINAELNETKEDFESIFK